MCEIEWQERKSVANLPGKQMIECCTRTWLTMPYNMAHDSNDWLIIQNIH